jgi:hypothetical protein
MPGQASGSENIIGKGCGRSASMGRENEEWGMEMTKEDMDLLREEWETEYRLTLEMERHRYQLLELAFHRLSNSIAPREALIKQLQAEITALKAMQS